MSSVVLNNTDLVFLLSEYLDDKSADNFFDSCSSYGDMLLNYPNRYKKNKKDLVYNQIKEELKKWDYDAIGFLYDNNCLLIQGPGIWELTWMVSLNENNGNVDFETKYGEGWKLNWCSNEEKNIKDDPTLLSLFKNYFDCY